MNTEYTSDLSIKIKATTHDGRSYAYRPGKITSMDELERWLLAVQRQDHRNHIKKIDRVIERVGNTIRMFIDGQLIHTYEQVS